MSQLCLRDITYGHGGLPLLENGNAIIKSGDRACIIGRNGVGKSSLLKIIMDEATLDHGTIEKSTGLRLAMLPQTVPDVGDLSVQDVVMKGLADLELEDWDQNHRVEKILSKMDISPSLMFSQLSGGLKRRVLLAKTLVVEPDILILDEPTNHLDIEAITWLENFLLNSVKTLLMITHDRQLMKNIANHILEIDNGRLISWRGHYDDYCRHKESSLLAEEKANALFDKRLAQEEVWIRQGIKARRTRNEGRVRHLQKMREQYRQRRQRVGQVKFSNLQSTDSSKNVIVAEEASFSYQNKPIIKTFSTLVMRGDKVGIIGKNGAGKSTLINLLLGILTPDSGLVVHSDNIQVAYFDQQQKSLDLDQNLVENIAGGSDTVTVNGREKHVIGYLQDFLFSPERAQKPIKSLSGGERNRAILAKLFLKPSNVLVMDEPTNDLDIETLELLEELLTDYKGTLLLVSHDRSFLNNIVSRTIVIENDGQIAQYAGGYDDYLQQRPIPTQKKSPPTVKTTTKANRKKTNHELNQLMKRIEKLESQQAKLSEQMAAPEFFQQEKQQCDEVYKKYQQNEDELKTLYERWEDHVE